MSRSSRRLGRCVAAAGALGLLAALAVGTPAAGAPGTAGPGVAGPGTAGPGTAGPGAGRAAGAKTPAVGATPHYRLAGRADTAPGTPPTFSCQLTVPASCYGPAQIRAAYGVDRLAAHGLTGAGRTIVIVDAFQSPTIGHDLATFDALFELPDSDLQIVAPDGLTPYDPTNFTMLVWAAEITLDVEWAHAVAPGAKIQLVLSRSDHDEDILSATKYAVDHDLGDVISQSFGENESCVDPDLLTREHALFARAALQGITLLASSGDQGAAQLSCDGSTFVKAVSSPASDPLVTAVGGTRLVADGLTGAYGSESGWNEPDFAAASGGGLSVLYGAPLYQALQHLPSRGVPDIAYNGAIVGGVLILWSSSGFGENLVFTIGGTSAGSPQWAGLTALAGQLAHGRTGQLNPRLYGLAATPAYGALFHDITEGDNTYHGEVEVAGFPALPGWDAVTGLGSPRADRLVPALAALS
jgi:subtilase family serine protease